MLTGTVQSKHGRVFQPRMLQFENQLRPEFKPRSQSSEKLEVDFKFSTEKRLQEDEKPKREQELSSCYGVTRGTRTHSNYARGVCSRAIKRSNPRIYSPENCIAPKVPSRRPTLRFLAALSMRLSCDIAPHMFATLGRDNVAQVSIWSIGFCPSLEQRYSTDMRYMRHDRVSSRRWNRERLL